MDQQFRSLERSIPHRSSTYPWSDRALSTSKWSPQHASSSPSKPHSPHFLARSSSGRSAHCPVKSVTGLATFDSSCSLYHANSRYSLAPPAARSSATSTLSPFSMDVTQPSTTARLLTLSAALVSGGLPSSIASRSFCNVAALSTNARSSCPTGRGSSSHLSTNTSPVPRSSLSPLQCNRPFSPTISYSPFQEVSGPRVAQSPS